MVVRRSRSEHPRSGAGGQRVPGLAKVGAVVIVLGLLADINEHAFVSHVNETVVGAFPLAEHAAHFVVLLGMVLVLAGIVADGVRAQRRHVRQEGNTRHAVR